MATIPNQLYNKKFEIKIQNVSNLEINMKG